MIALLKANETTANNGIIDYRSPVQTQKRSPGFEIKAYRKLPSSWTEHRSNASSLQELQPSAGERSVERTTSPRARD